jgi:hypothetical protein
MRRREAIYRRKDYTIDVRRLGNSRQWRQYYERVRTLKYLEDTLGHRGFFEEVFLPAPLAVSVAKVERTWFVERYGELPHGLVRVFYDRTDRIPEDFQKAIVKKCLVCQ